MKDEDQIKQLYHDMYDAMVAKDEAELDRVHDDSFILIHMTGMRQDKQTYIRAILDGTLNYYSETTEDLKIHISGNTATLTGHSRVAAAVFGGGRHSGTNDKAGSATNMMRWVSQRSIKEVLVPEREVLQPHMI